MDVGARAGVLRSFATLPDPRMQRTRKHELLDLLVIAICAAARARRASSTGDGYYAAWKPPRPRCEGRRSLSALVPVGLECG
jgi:hypothetical protein